MKLRSFLDTWQGTRLENKFARGAILGLIGTNLLLGFHAIQKNSTVVIAPPEITKAVEVSRSAASRDYLEAWSWSVAMLLGNVTPANADFVKKGMEPLLAPDIFHGVTTALDRQIAEIKHDRITSSFDPRKVSFENETGKFFVSGYRIVGGPAAEDKREEATYELEWTVRNYRPLLTFVKNYAGKPLTKKELERKEQIEDRNQRIEEQRVRKQQHQESSK